MIGALGIGALRPDEIADKVEIARTFEPRPVYRDRYEALFGAFLDHYKSSKSFFRRLNHT